MSAEPDTCYRWSRDLVVAHAVFASGFITAPVAVLLLLHRPRSGRAIFFAAFAAFCTTISLVLCCRFYAELRRPPWPRWLSASSGGRQQQVEEDDGGEGQEITTARDVSSHGLRHPEQQPVMMMPCVEMEMKADALARIPCYGYERPAAEDGGAAEDCAVCLGEVGEGELVRRLPACRHVFHRECIDLWLRAHATCPVCRSGVLSPAAAAEVAVDVVGAAHGRPRAAGLAPPDIIFSGRSGPRFWYGPSISRLGQ